MMTSRICIALMFFSAGCGGSKADDSSAPLEDTDTQTDSDTTEFIDDTSDTGSAGPLASLVRVGLATVDGTYVGTEDVLFTADKGYGEVLCHVTYDLNSTSDRDDCPYCDWAYDLVSSNATILVDQGHCQGVLGVDESNIETLNDQVRSYGYNADYVGHAQVLMFHDGKRWTSGSFATFDDVDKTFSYEWADGFHPY